MHAMFDFPANTPWAAVGMPKYGEQDIGVTPGGALDLFAHQTGQILLGQDPSVTSVEFIFPLHCKVRANGWVVLTGAPRKKVRLQSPGGADQPVEHGQVIRVEAGQELNVSEAAYGLRSYLSWRVRDAEGEALHLDHRKRGPFAEAFSWPDSQGSFRCLPGPEWQRLRNPELIECEGWQASRELSNLGIRLESRLGRLEVKDAEMISSVVADGTVQLTPSGPYVLLRHRQTVGGYPRILNVISADVDLLAQQSPGQAIQFKMVDEEEARTAARLKARELEHLKQSFSP